MNEHLIEKFPAILKDALMNKKVSFPEDIIIDFEPQFAYRVIPRRENNLIHSDDFLSQVELLYVKKCRALKGIDENDIGEYSCSLFTNIDKLKNYLHMPRKNKVIIQGNVTCENGIIQYNMKTTHIHWWLYENNDVISDFEVRNFENK